MIKSAAAFQGGLENAFLGIDKTKFHHAATWEAGKWCLLGLVFTSIAVATANKDTRLSTVAVCGGITLVVSALRYAYVRYMVLGYRHKRFFAYCTKQANNPNSGEVELTKYAFEMFLKTKLGMRVLALYASNSSAGEIFNQLTKGGVGTRKITANDIYTGMIEGKDTDITEDAIAKELLASDAAMYDCMNKRATLEQTTRKAASSNRLNNTIVALELANLIN
jgi:hypothetical protein